VTAGGAGGSGAGWVQGGAAVGAKGCELARVALWRLLLLLCLLPLLLPLLLLVCC
jgi:hypothetical protein